MPKQAMTPEERRQAFAFYLGQDINDYNGKRCLLSTHMLAMLSSQNAFADCHLLLKPLAAISDADAKAIATIRRYVNYKDAFGVKNGYWVTFPFPAKEKFVNWTDLYVAEADYLRSRGYCLPYMGHDLVAKGVAKLTESNA